MKTQEIINRRYSENKDVPESIRMLIQAWIFGSSSPSYDDDEIIEAIIAYGDARVKEAKEKWDFKN